MEILHNNIHYEGTTEMNSNNVLLQREGAPSHTAKLHQLPAERKVTFIKRAMWPANSSDLNLVDYSANVAVTTVCNCKTAETGNIVDKCCTLSQKFIDRSINERRQRLKCVLQQNGRHVEYLLK